MPPKTRIVASRGLFMWSGPHGEIAEYGHDQ